MIIECAGLPGAGKTTICRLVKHPHGGKSSVPLSALRPSGAMLRVAWQIFLLSATARPLQLKRLKRGFNLTVFLRHYLDHDRDVLLDQGVVQKLWSMLADAEAWPAERLRAVLQNLRPFAPDHVVWLETPLEMAAARMASRSGGRSRYDGLNPQQATAILLQRAGLLEMLARDFSAETGARLVVFDGLQDPAVNAARIDALF